MNTKTFVFKNIRQNFKKYFSFFICQWFSIFIFTIYSLLMFNPYISYSLENISSIRYILIVCNIVIFFFSIIFIKYANSAFLKTRKKEFGLLYLMGLNNKDIKKIIFLENMTISCIAIISGVLLGVLFSGVFFKVILYALGIKDKIAFVITPISIILTIAIFSVVLLLINISSSKVITKSKIIELIKASKKPISPKKNSTILSFLGIAILVLNFTAYGFLKYSINSIISIILFLILFVISMYLIVFYTSRLIIDKISNNKKVYYSKTNMVVLGNLRCKFTQNGRIILTMILLDVVVLVLVGIAFSGYRQPYTVAKNRFSTDLSILNIQNNYTNDLYNIVKDTLKLHDDEVKRIDEISFIKRSNVERTTLECIIPVSFYNSAAMRPSISDKQNVSSRIDIPNGSAVIVLPMLQKPSWYEDTGAGEKLNISFDNITYQFVSIGTILNIKLGFNDNITSFIVINDDDYTKMKQTVGSKYCGSLINIDFTDWSKSESIVNDLYTNISNKIHTYDTDNIASKMTWYKFYKDFNFQIMFLAIFIGILFFITTGGMLYFRQINELESLKADTISLIRVGLEKYEINKIMTMELRVIFFYPFIIALLVSYMMLGLFIHTAVAANDTIFSVILNSSLVFGFYFILQVVYYRITRMSLTKKIFSKSIVINISKVM